MSLFDPSLPDTKPFVHRMRRIFHPVGQGAFYTETFLLAPNQYHTVVYDCGVGGDETPMIKCLDTLRKTYGEIIDIVFISHFHADHISHISTLLNDFSVKALVVPDVTSEVAVDAFLNNYIAIGQGDNNTSIHLIERLLSGAPMIEGTKVIRVDQLDGEGEKPVNDNMILELNEGRIDSDTLSSGMIIRMYDWEYILCNYPCPRSSKLIGEMQKRYPELLDALLQQKWAEARALLDTISFDDLSKLYKDCFPNDENEESMTVLSRPVTDDFAPSSCCLYTGDSPFRTKKRLNYVKKYYGNHWDKIGTLQSPHHGSDNDNPEDLHDKYRTCVVCYGTKNTYGHPGKQALLSMAKAKCNIRLVTEEETSCFDKYIHY